MASPPSSHPDPPPHRQRCAGKHEAVFSLPVLKAERVGGHPTRIKRSKASWWRFGVLLLVQLAIATHLIVWVIQKNRAGGVSATLSPVEPSESMYTLETGVVNAGFVFFAVAILSTLIFGRFFCGWGCHVVALQDACTWAMTKLRVRPKPFRSRLLMWVPVCVAFYMFVWPTVRRVVLKPLAGDAWPHLAVWLGDTPQWPGWSSGLVVEDFWKTFPPWYVAIPFLAVCGFATVYFLGSKGFCTYGCPYGGFFGPADRLALGKIRVTDACEGCGHCTAVCTSNVRVHEEVRDFGMVVDPGCMKCLDCISVCPNDALYFGLGAPSVLARPRDDEAKARRAARSGNWDLSWPEELAVAAVFVALVQSFRGMLNQVPFLMALGMAGIGAFCAWKLLTLIRDPNSRLQSLQLKYKGRVRPAGAVFAVLTVAYLGAAVWGGVVKYNLWRAGLIADRIMVPREVAFAPGYVAEAHVRADAEAAIARYIAAGPPGPRGGEGGLGWAHRPQISTRLAWLSMVCSRPKDADRYLREALEAGRPDTDAITALGQIMLLEGLTNDAVLAMYREQLAKHPELIEIRRILAAHALEAGRPADAVALYDEALKALPHDPITRFHAAGVYFSAGQPVRGAALLEEAAAVALKRRGHAHELRMIAQGMLETGNVKRAIDLVEAAAERTPALPGIFADLGVAYVMAGRLDDAIRATTEAQRRAPLEPDLADRLVHMCTQAGRAAEAKMWEQKAQELRAKGGAQPPVPAPAAAPAAHEPRY